MILKHKYPRKIRKHSKNKIPAMHRKAWKEFSEFIRKRGADKRGFNTCFTCSAVVHWKEMNAGHFRHNVLDFDEMNLNPQCVRCNKWLSGRLDVYSRMLTLKYGHEAVEALHRRADLAQKGDKKSVFELEEIYLKYKAINEEH